MKSLSELILEADENQNNNSNGQNNNNNSNNDNSNNDNSNNNQDNKNKSVKGDAGTFKTWPVFNTTVKGWIKVMSGQEEVKDSFFDGGFLVPTSVQGLNGNTQAKSATLSKQLDNSCKVAIVEFSNDYCFILDGLKPYGYMSTGWSKGKGPAIADVIKQMKAESKPDNTQNNNGNKDNGNKSNDNNGTM